MVGGTLAERIALRARGLHDEESEYMLMRVSSWGGGDLRV